MGSTEATTDAVGRGLAVGGDEESRLSRDVLLAGEGRYCTLYEQIPLMYFTLGADGTVLMVNAYGAEHLGYRPRELIGRPVLEVFHPEDRDAVAARLRQAVAEPGAVATWRFRKLRKDGSPLWVRETVRVVQEDGRPIVLVVCEDVTEQVEVEERLANYRDELRALSAQLTLAEARERRRIAEGLHDRTGQALVAAKLQLAALQEDEDDPETRRSLRRARDFLRHALNQTRSLTFELSCPVLYRLGLAAALRDLAEEMERGKGLRFEFAGEPGLAPLATEQKVLLYRAAQELLHNVVKHARASRVLVSIGRVAGRLEIAVEDDGVGFDAAHTRSRPTSAGGFGLFSIRERLHYLGGRLEFEAVPAGGTRASILVPLAPPRAEDRDSERARDANDAPTKEARS